MKKYLYIFLMIVCLPKLSFAASETLLIHSFQISGTDSSTDEFVAIKNVSNAIINLEKYTLVKKSQSSTSWNILMEFPTTSIEPGQIISISHINYIGNANFKYTSSTYSIASNNSIAIRRPDKTIIDLVGLGDSISYEGASVQNPEAAEILKRVSDVDTDNNQVDFVSIKISETSPLDPNVNEIIISEIMPNPNEGGEWFELFNPTSQDISLSGLKICDGIGAIRCYVFKNEDYLGTFEHKIYSQDLTKITLNNSGDFLEIIGPDEQVYASTGENYGDAEKGYSLSLFGSEYKWTYLPTPGKDNVYTEKPAEEEKATAKKPLTKKTTVKKTSTPKVATDENENNEDDPEVKSASIKENESLKESFKVDNKIFGIGLMAFSIIILLGYNLWLKKDEIAKIYYKIRSRDN